MKPIRLIGVEQVHRAGETINAAADRIAQAAATIDDSNRQFLIRYEELILRIERSAETSYEKHRALLIHYENLVVRREQAAKEGARSIWDQLFGK